jgi:hypothetical protein
MNLPESGFIPGGQGCRGFSGPVGSFLAAFGEYLVT